MNTSPNAVLAFVPYDTQRPLPPGCSKHFHLVASVLARRRGPPAHEAIGVWHFVDAGDAAAWQGQLAAQGTTTLAARPRIMVDGPVAEGGLVHVELLARRADLSPQDFLQYWRDVHGPIAARMPAVRRYWQFMAGEPGDAAAAPFDGVAMLWFDSVDAMRENAKHPAFAQAQADMPNFVDATRSTSVLMQ